MRTSKNSNTNCKWSVSRTHSNSHNQLRLWKGYVRRTLCRKWDTNRANDWITLHVSQECSNWYYTWPHSNPHLTMQFKIANNEINGKLKLRWQRDNSSDDNENNHYLCWSPIGIENTGYCEIIKKIHTGTASLLISNSISTKKTKICSQCYQHNRISVTLQDQKEDTDCRILRGNFGAVQVH